MDIKKQKLNDTDEQLFISGIINSSFFKEHIRNAWSNGRMFDKELHNNRSLQTDVSELPDKALRFEEWFSRHYKP